MQTQGSPLLQISLKIFWWDNPLSTSTQKIKISPKNTAKLKFKFKAKTTPECSVSFKNNLESTMNINSLPDEVVFFFENSK